MNPPVPVQVKFVVSVKFSTTAAAVVLVRAMLPEPNAIDRATVPVQLTLPTDMVNPLSARLPLVWVYMPAGVQIVALPASDSAMVEVPPKVVLNATAVELMVTVPVPESASKVAVSTLVGADAPLAPPEVADQFAVDVLSQVPEPPTQNLAAI